MSGPDLQRIEHIREYCEQIQKTILRYGASYEVFSADIDYQQSVSFSILQIGELSGKLSEDFRSATTGYVQWGPIKGMRNMVAHNYGNMSLDVIWDTATKDIPALCQLCQKWLAEYDI